MFNPPTLVLSAGCLIRASAELVGWADLEARSPPAAEPARALVRWVEERLVEDRLFEAKLLARQVVWATMAIKRTAVGIYMTVNLSGHLLALHAIFANEPEHEQATAWATTVQEPISQGGNREEYQSHSGLVAAR